MDHTAALARSCGDDSDGGELTIPSESALRGDPFGADRQTVRSVFDIAAFDDLAVGGQQCRAHFEVGVRRHGTRAGVARGLDERDIFRVCQ